MLINFIFIVILYFNDNIFCHIIFSFNFILEFQYYRECSVQLFLVVRYGI